jgi:hypothetical protein
MDEADKTTEQSEFYQRAALYKSRKYEIPAVAIGECLFCGAPLDEGVRWCDFDCMNMYSKENQ